ncbi:hypothetical protein RQP46_005045 [Phenoliferia psychrophenolica]
MPAPGDAFDSHEDVKSASREASLAFMGCALIQKTVPTSTRSILVCTRETVYQCRYRIITKFNGIKWVVDPKESVLAHSHDRDPRILEDPEWRPKLRRRIVEVQDDPGSYSQSNLGSLNTDGDESNSQCDENEDEVSCPYFAEDDLGDNSSLIGSPVVDSCNLDPTLGGNAQAGPSHIPPPLRPGAALAKSRAQPSAAMPFGSFFASSDRASAQRSSSNLAHRPYLTPPHLQPTVVISPRQQHKAVDDRRVGPSNPLPPPLPAATAKVSSTSTNNSYTTSELHTISAQEAPARLDNDAPEDVDGEALDLPEPDPDLDGEPMLLDEFELSKEDPSPAEDELAPTQEAAAWSVETLSRHLSQSGLAHLASTLHDAGAFDHPRGLTYSTKNHLEEVVDWIQTSGGVPFGHLSVLRLRKALIALDDSPSPSLADLAIHAEGPIWPLKQLGAALDEKYGLSYLAEALRDVGVLDDASALYYATTEYLEDTVKMVQDLRKNAEPPLRGITIGHLRQALQALGEKLAV